MDREAWHAVMRLFYTQITEWRGGDKSQHWRSPNTSSPELLGPGKSTKRRPNRVCAATNYILTKLRGVFMLEKQQDAVKGAYVLGLVQFSRNLPSLSLLYFLHLYHRNYISGPH